MRALPGCSRVLTRLDDTRSAGCDYWVFVGSLPQRLQIDVQQLDTGGPYLRARDDLRQRWRALLDQRVAPQGTVKRVGLVWGGRPENEYERRRSLPFEALVPLGRIPGVRLVSLQMGPRAQDPVRHPGVLPIEVLTPQELGTFEDTAALMAELDAVVTIDTAFSHLAGALGGAQKQVKVRRLLAFVPRAQQGQGAANGVSGIAGALHQAAGLRVSRGPAHGEKVVAAAVGREVPDDLQQDAGA
jgi:hypothetical protein